MATALCSHRKARNPGCELFMRVRLCSTMNLERSLQGLSSSHELGDVALLRHKLNPGSGVLHNTGNSRHLSLFLDCKKIHCRLEQAKPSGCKHSLSSYAGYSGAGAAAASFKAEDLDD